MKREPLGVRPFAGYCLLLFMQTHLSARRVARVAAARGAAMSLDEAKARLRAARRALDSVSEAGRGVDD